MTIKPILPVEVVRDEDGWFTHPQYFTEPEWDGVDCMTQAEFDKYIAERGIETATTSLEGDDSEMHERYCEEGQVDCTAWTPSKPAGEGWFMLSIHDTEDGPICVWGRRTEDPFVSEVVAATDESDLFSGQSAQHEIGSALQSLTNFTRHSFEQLMRYEDGRTPLYLTEEQYNAIRELVAQAGSSPDPEPAAYLHQVVCGDGEPDQALSFEADSFPLSKELGFCSIAREPLFKQAPAAQDVAGLVEALEQIIKHYPNPDITHVDYRVHACKQAEQALAAHRAQQGKQ